MILNYLGSKMKDELLDMVGRRVMRSEPMVWPDGMVDKSSMDKADRLVEVSPFFFKFESGRFLSRIPWDDGNWVMENQPK